MTRYSLLALVLAVCGCQRVPVAPPPPLPPGPSTLEVFRAVLVEADATCGPVAWELEVKGDGIRFSCGRPPPVGKVRVPGPKIAEVKP